MSQTRALEILRARIAEWQFAREQRLALPDASLRTLVEYNDALSYSWTEGSSARRSDVDKAEQVLFGELSRAIAAKHQQTSTADGTVLVLDWGAGTGKVVPWLGDSVTLSALLHWIYVHVDFSPAMSHAARQQALAILGESSEHVTTLFALADVTESRFGPADWWQFKKAFNSIVGICAGGTIGNFDDATRPSAAFQHRFLQSMRRCDHLLVTFLDATNLRRVLRHYSMSGLSSDRFDALHISIYSLIDSVPRLVSRDLIPLAQASDLADDSALLRASSELQHTPHLVAFEMWKGGRSTGQISRHYSREHVESCLLEGYQIQEKIHTTDAISYWLCPVPSES